MSERFQSKAIAENAIGFSKGPIQVTKSLMKEVNGIKDSETNTHLFK